jgi:hypothetical protein
MTDILIVLAIPVGAWLIALAGLVLAGLTKPKTSSVFPIHPDAAGVEARGKRGGP